MFLFRSRVPAVLLALSALGALGAGSAGCAAQPGGGATAPTRGGGKDELVQVTQELLDAIAPGKKEVWDRYLAADAIYTDENGKTFTRKEFLEELKPLPPYARGTLKIKHSIVRLSSDHAVVVHQDEENEEIYGQKITTGFVITDTWRLRQNRWELLASSVVGLASDPVAVKLGSARLDAFAGEYSVGSGASFVVRREGDHLVAAREGRPPIALYAEGDGLFFARGSTDRWAFVADDSGAIAEMRQRRRGNDVVWKKKRP
ncbi:nuclear transport factor 2 family protein [Pendulispora albinea]|uniref:Nuclear transport factor 2 family protein n=1 Tax=Pendulispora albinea TaxID=2741071 RepID=A0ABZ2M403_9BACT